MKKLSDLPRFILILALAPLALATAAQRGPAARGCQGAGQANGACAGACAAVASDTAPLALGNQAQMALLFQIDEERMARELYTAFGAKWNLPPFANIPQAEARHEAGLRQLAARAGLAAPAAVTGRFDSAEVQKRYDDLLALGLTSADGALRTGAYVEEVDIADLNTLIATTDNAALKATATALKTASGHHLQAFVGVLTARGITYTPQVLKADEYQAMLAPAGGGAGRGMGRGQGQGRGWCGGQGRGHCPLGG